MDIFHVFFKKTKMGIEIVLIIVLIYIIIGFGFSIFFITTGAAKIDEGAKDMNWSLKLMLIPGSISLWPFLLKKILTNKK